MIWLHGEGKTPLSIAGKTGVSKSRSNVKKKTIDIIFGGMPQRIQVVIDAKGALTK